MHFYGLTRHEVLYRLPGCQGWAMYAWAIENNGWSDVDRDSDGYIAQEIQRRRRAKR